MRVRLEEVDGRRLTFSAEADDGVDRICAGPPPALRRRPGAVRGGRREEGPGQLSGRLALRRRERPPPSRGRCGGGQPCVVGRDPVDRCPDRARPPGGGRRASQVRRVEGGRIAEQRRGEGTRPPSPTPPGRAERRRRPATGRPQQLRPRQLGRHEPDVAPSGPVAEGGRVLLARDELHGGRRIEIPAGHDRRSVALFGAHLLERLAEARAVEARAVAAGLGSTPWHGRRSPAASRAASRPSVYGSDLGDGLAAVGDHDRLARRPLRRRPPRRSASARGCRPVFMFYTVALQRRPPRTVLPPISE